MHQATHDALTGLPNRREFMARLTAELLLPRTVRVDPVVLFCDLDGFKGVNDRYGHVAGDVLLAEVADRLRRCVRERDVVSRFGGDEFIILCRGASSTDAAELCRRIATVLAAPIYLDGEPVIIGASIGVVTAEDDVNAEELIHRADALMYAAKQQRPPAAVTPGVRTVAA
jgi:diguanylate cyclase (GGDEF)-like protein